MWMASLHLIKDRDRAKARCRLQHRDHLRVEEVREGIRPATSSHLIYSGRRSMILLEAIRRGEADRCLRGRDRRAICLSERHVKPHLVIGDVAAGQWVDPSMRRSIHGAGRSRSHDDRAPGESSVASRWGAGPSGRASPSLRCQPRNDFLILIVGDSHLDCRATLIAGIADQAGKTGFASHLVVPCWVEVLRSSDKFSKIEIFYKTA